MGREISLGKCKDCGAPVAEGEQYCESCLLLRDLGLSGDNAIEENSSYDEIEGMNPLEDLALDDSNLVFDSDANLDETIMDSNDDELGELNIDDDILSFLNGVEEGEPKELNAEDLDDIDSLLAKTEPEAEDEELQVSKPQEKEEKATRVKEKKKRAIK